MVCARDAVKFGVNIELRAAAFPSACRGTPISVTTDLIELTLADSS